MEEYAPCPRCGARSLASLVGHICADCADSYVHCVECGPGPSRLRRLWWRLMNR